MADANRREAWGHTSIILAQLDNLQAFRGNRPAAKPSDYDPFRAADVKAAAPTTKIDPKASLAAMATAMGFEVPE